jgi:hypothetical protein
MTELPLGIIPVVATLFGIYVTAWLCSKNFYGIRISSENTMLGNYCFAIAVPVTFLIVLEKTTSFTVRSFGFFEIAVACIAVSLILAFFLDKLAARKFGFAPAANAVCRRLEINGVIKHLILTTVMFAFVLGPLAIVYLLNGPLVSSSDKGLLLTFLVGSSRYPYSIIWLASSGALFLHLAILGVVSISRSQT